MTKLDQTPFVDINGNLVIPPGLLCPRQQTTATSTPSEYEMIAHIAGVRLRIVIKGGKILTVKRLENEPDDCSDLLRHSLSSMEFWDNPEDDAVWNNAETT